jgi:hypothetical protein
MRRPLVTGFLLVALAAAGCGTNKEEEFRKEYRPLNSQIRDLGQDVGRSISGASGKSDEQISDLFGDLSTRTGKLKKDVDALDPPGDLTDDNENLVEAMGDAEVALRDIKKAAADSDAPAARRATIQLVAASEDLRDSRTKLEKATAPAK